MTREENIAKLAQLRSDAEALVKDYNDAIQNGKYGTVFLSYMVYNPDNNYIDDIMERYDFILDRGLEVGGMYEFRHVNGHIEVFLDGEFQFSADTMQEAYCELKAG